MAAERNGFSGHFAKARYLVNDRSAYSYISAFVTTASYHDTEISRTRYSDNYFTDRKFCKLKSYKFYASYELSRRYRRSILIFLYLWSSNFLNPKILLFFALNIAVIYAKNLSYDRFQIQFDKFAFEIFFCTSGTSLYLASVHKVQSILSDRDISLFQPYEYSGHAHMK